MPTTFQFLTSEDKAIPLSLVESTSNRIEDEFNEKEGKEKRGWCSVYMILEYIAMKYKTMDDCIMFYEKEDHKNAGLIYTLKSIQKELDLQKFSSGYYCN